MIRYAVNESKRQVIGWLDHTEWDAHNKICKMIQDTEFCVVPNKKYMMPSQFKVVVTCDPRDDFSVEIGKQIAKERLMKNYYAALDKRIDKFREAALVFNEKIFENSENNA